MYAAPTPSPMSVNIFGLRLTSDVQKRSSNGHPHHSTTGVASASCNQFATECGIACATAGTMCSSNGTVNASPIQKRRVMSRSSGFSSSAITDIGSRAIPQMGQDPGSSRTISGCMGQVHFVFDGIGGISGSSAMPHFGQAAGLSETTSGSMGQIYFVPLATGGAGAADSRCKYFSGLALNFDSQLGLQK